MGYDAFVICNCFKEGKTEEPPYKELVELDDEGVHLEIEDLYKQDEEEYFKRHREFENWKRTACPHEDMELVSEHLSNISGMGAFRSVLNELDGEKRFPILSKYLPVANTGTLPTECASQFLKDLENLEHEQSKEEKAVLKLKLSGERIQSVNADQSNIFMWSAYDKQNYGINKDGFFIIENRKFLWKRLPILAFQSKDFKQVLVGKDKYRFVDNKTNKQFTGMAKIYPIEDEDPQEDIEFYVDTETMTIGIEYDYMIKPLKKLTMASIESGNPIIWT